MDKNIIAYLKDKFKEEQYLISNARQIEIFENALKQVDLYTIMSLVNQGFSIKEYEKTNESSIKELLSSIPVQIMAIVKPIHPYKYIEYYYYNYRIEDRDSMDFLLINKIDTLKKEYLNILEYLYQNGADINMVEKNIDNKNSFFSMRKRVRTHSPFSMAVCCVDDIKSNDILKWFFSKEDFVLNDKDKHDNSILRNVYNSDTHLSTETLRLLLNNNIPLETYTLTTRFGESARSIDKGEIYSSLEDCYYNGCSKTKLEKIKVLLEYATEEQKQKFFSNCDSSIIEHNLKR